MVVLFIALIGLCLGSFVNALVWRLRLHREHYRLDDEPSGDTEEVTGSPLRTLGECLYGAAEEVWDWVSWPFRRLRPGKGKPGRRKPLAAKYSLAKGRSMCPHCEHELAAKDLIPLFSWLWLSGKCRYCRKPISWQYPVVELLVAGVFVVSYLFWPEALAGWGGVRFAIWLLLVTGFTALAVYDAKYRYLPSEVLYPLLWLAVGFVAADVAGQGAYALVEAGVGVLIAWGLFFAIYCAGEVLHKRLIGYGDVRLAVLLGLVAGGPWAALLLIFLASLLGVLFSVPMLIGRRADRSTELPYGPFLLSATVVVVLGVDQLMSWLDRYLLL